VRWKIERTSQAGMQPQVTLGFTLVWTETTKEAQAKVKWKSTKVLAGALLSLHIPSLPSPSHTGKMLSLDSICATSSQNIIKLFRFAFQ
jgi:hypothetical protein